MMVSNAKYYALRLRLLMAAVVLLLSLAPLQTAAAHRPAETKAIEEQDASDLIWSGLWSGANLNISGLFDGGSSSGTSSAGTPHASTTDRPAAKHVALGDSVAAGAGLPAEAGATAEDQRCRRSDQSYPFLVAGNLDMPLLHIACSGATAGDLITPQRFDSSNADTRPDNLPAQLRRAYNGGDPTVITITAGANDIKWTEYIRGCYAYRCDTKAFDEAAGASLLILRGKLHAAFYDIALRSSASAKKPVVVVTGYYNPLSHRCAAHQKEVTEAEIRWLARQINRLNNTIHDVAGHYPFVHYAPVDFTGHDLCSKNPWVQGLGDADPFHPNAEGQQAIARSVLSTIRR